MAIQVRRGNEADFDASKMLPGEWAVSLDTKFVRMCFSPGIVLRMATYEGFEADKAQFQAILAECRSIQEVVQRIGSEVSEKASLTIEYSNSAKESAERAKIYADNAEAVTGVQIATKDRAGLVKGGDNHIAEDGTLMLITATTETTMPNSYDGRLKIEEIGGGESQQGENPSPTNLQEIKKSVVSEIRTHGKNLLDLRNGKSGTGADVTFTKNDDGSYLMTGTASNTAGNMWFKGNYNQAPLEDGSNVILTLYAGRSYYISDCRVYSLINGTTISRSGLVVPTYDFPVTGVRNDTLEEGKTYNQTIYPMVVEGDTLLSWEPYTESVITLSQPIDLYGRGDVQDVITPKQIKRKYVSVDFDGSVDEDLRQDSTYMFRIPLTQRGVAYGENQLCTRLKRGASYSAIQKTENTFGVSGVALILHIEGVASIDELRAWLVEHPMTVVYEMLDETTEELPIADQIALNSLSTFDGITYLEFDSEIEPTFKGEYGTSKVGGYTLEGMLTGRNGELMGNDYANRITALEATVVNNI